METNAVDIKDKKTLVRLLRNCYYVYGYVVLSYDEGYYVKLQKTDLMSKLLELDSIDMNKFQYDTHDNIVYIN